MQNISSVVEVNKDIYTRGCIEAITETLEPNMNIVSAVCFTFAIVQVFHICFFVFRLLNPNSCSCLQCFWHVHFKDKYRHNNPVGLGDDAN